MVVLNLYIIHCNRLENRLPNIEKLKSLGGEQSPSVTVNVTIINEHQPETINVNSVKNLVKLEKLPDDENQFYAKFVRQMSLEILSNTFNHFKALQLCSKNPSSEFNIILEDDVMYSDKIYSQIITLINNLDNIDWDLIFLGQPSEKQTTNANTLNLTNMETNDMLLHCCESYMVKSKTAQELILNFFPIRFVFNIHLSFILNKHVLKCLKIFPNICGDGSKMGEFTSSILINNVLIFNDTYKSIYLQLENSKMEKGVIEDIKEKFENNKHKTNPDFIYLEALFYKKTNDIEKATELFEKAMIMFEKDKVPMNNTSSFLKNYIELYKYIQMK